MAVTARTALVPLFLVSLAAVGYETALTRYFAVAKWSEYGYWVISIVMVGFAFSGVLLALFRDVFARHGETLLSALPALLVATAAIGFHFTTINPFNPLQLQNPVTWEAQLWNIAGYYACLLPFFFLAGTFISLSFVLNADRIGLVYGYDLTGAGTGAAFVLAAMFVVHAFFLVPLLLIPLAASACFVAGRRRWAGAAAAGVALLGAEALLLLDNRAEFNDFKAIYAPLHTPDARVVASVLSPRGDYALLDDFTERVDTDISNNAGMLGVPGPPRTFGLYRDGNRIAALPKPGVLDVGYAAASLDALPYLLIPHANVLLAGASGGFRTAEVLALGAAHVHLLEPEPVLLRALEQGPWTVACAGRRRSGDSVRRRAGGGNPQRRRFTTSSTCPRIFWMPPRPTSRHSLCRRSRTTCVHCGQVGSCLSRCRSGIFRSTHCVCWQLHGPHCLPQVSTIRRHT